MLIYSTYGIKAYHKNCERKPKMNIKKALLKLAGKDDFDLDSKIGISYLMRICWNYGWMMIGGKFVSLFAKGISSDVFIGKHVKLINRKQLTVGSKTKIHNCVKIDALSTDGVSIGSHCVIGAGTSIECTGSLSFMGVGTKIGDRTTFGESCFFGAAGGGNSWRCCHGRSIYKVKW